MSSSADSLVFGHIELRLGERRLFIDGQPVALGSRGFDLLKALVSKRDRVVGKDELLDEVWPGLVVEENNLQVQISGLRRVLGAQAIATVSGLGYRFTLAPGPLAAAPPSDDPFDPTPSQPMPLGLMARVLVADDNKVNRLLLCRSLALMGCEVSSADNGRQALALLREQRFDLLMLDLVMPELDGFGLLKLRAGDPALREVSVIVTSALGGVAPVARCIELGAEDFLHKPVDPWLLKARVESSLARKRQRDRDSEALRRLMPGAPAEATQLADACVLVARLQDLDTLAEAHPPQVAMALLSDWSLLMFDAVAEHGGDVIQFGGDGFIALFGAPASAVAAARSMVELAAQFNRERATARSAPLCFGIGLARGSVVVGLASSGQRTAFACIGAPVLRAGQLAAVGARAGHPILLDSGVQGSQAEVTALVRVRADDGFAAFALDQRHGWPSKES